MKLELFLIVIVIIFVTIIFRLWVNEYSLNCIIEDLNKKNLRLEKEKERAEEWKEHYKYFSDLSDKIAARNVALMKENKDLKRENLNLKMQSSHTFIIDEDTKAAIRYAMIHSHPDKGGKEEDFVRFHALYEKIKSK